MIPIIMASWPSGLRRCVKAAVRKGVGSNPTLVIALLIVAYKWIVPEVECISEIV